MSFSMDVDDATQCDLSTDYQKVPLEALNASCRRRIGMHMNLEGSLNNNVQMINNYQGLAEMVGFQYKEVANLERHKDPTFELLKEWTERPELAPTVGVLWNNLKELERFDVLGDVKELIKRDCDRYLAIKSRLMVSKPIQESNVTSQNDPEREQDIMAVGDVDTLTPTMYDAFVCYNPEGPDIDFVRLLIEELEIKNGLKLFVPWRDDLVGAGHNTLCAKLIERRCKRMIIVLSPRYLQSQVCDFQTQFAQSLSPGSRDRRLIPVLIENCVIPELLRHITCCNYTRKEVLEWFWNRLVLSVKAPLAHNREERHNLQRLDSISLDTSYSEWSGSSLSSLSSSDETSSLSTGASSLSVPGSGTDGPQSGDIPQYMEFAPASPQSTRKFNNYAKMSNLVKGNRARQPSPQARLQDETEIAMNVYSYTSAESLSSDGPPSELVPRCCSGTSPATASLPMPRSQAQPSGNTPIPPPRSPKIKSHRTTAQSQQTPPPLPPRENSRKLAQKDQANGSRQEYFC